MSFWPSRPFDKKKAIEMFANRGSDSVPDLKRSLGELRTEHTRAPLPNSLVHFNTVSRECEKQSSVRIFVHLRKRRVDEPRDDKDF